MLDALIHAAAIANYGNCVLASRDSTGAAELIRVSGVFGNIESWDFVRCSNRGRPVSLASLPSAWYRRLLKEDVVQLRLTLGTYERADLTDSPDPVHPSIGIYCEGNAGIEMWRPEWKVMGHRHGAPRLKLNWSSERCARMLARPEADDVRATSKWRESIEALAELMADKSPIWKPRLELLLSLSAKEHQDFGKIGAILPPAIATPSAKLLCANALRTHLMVSSPDFAALRQMMSLNSEFIRLEASVLQSIANLIETSSALVSLQTLKRAA